MVGRPKSMGVLARSVVAAVVALLLLAGTAVAQNPTEQGYSSPGGTVQQQITSTPAPTASVTPTKKSTPAAPAAQVKAAPKAKSNGKGLPFTGLELGLVLAAGVALLGLGFGLRRFARPSEA
jgi:hypothetical protein